MAKSADAADLKSAGRKRLWEFKSPSGHQFEPLDTRHFGLHLDSSITKSTVSKCLVIGWYSSESRSHHAEKTHYKGHRDLGG